MHTIKKSYLIIALAALAGVFMFNTAFAQKVEMPANGIVWNVRCNKDKDGKEAPAGTPKRGRCEAFQRLSVKETNQRFVEFAIGFPSNKPDARGVVVLPLGILLPSGVQMKIGDNAPLKFSVRYCDPQGCFAYVNLSKEILETLRNSESAAVSFESLKPEKLEVKMSLKGLGKSLDEVM